MIVVGVAPILFCVFNITDGFALCLFLTNVRLHDLVVLSLLNIRPESANRSQLGLSSYPGSRIWPRIFVANGATVCANGCPLVAYPFLPG